MDQREHTVTLTTESTNDRPRRGTDNILRLKNLTWKKLASECKIIDESEVNDYVTKREREILKEHIENVNPIKAPGQKGGRKDYYTTKLEPGNRRHCHPLYGRTLEDLEIKIVAYYLGIENGKDTLLEILKMAVDEQTDTGRRTIQRFNKHFQNLSDVKVTKLKEKDIRNALESLLTKRITKKEFNESITALNKIYDYCVYEHMTIINVREIIATFRAVKMTGRHIFRDNTKEHRDLSFNRREASLIVSDALTNPDYRSLAVATLITTGLRAGELLALEIDDVRYDDGYIFVHQIESSKKFEILPYTKSNESREVFLSPEAKSVIKKVLELRLSDSSPSPYLFLNECSKDGKMHLRAIDNHMREYIHGVVLGYGSEREARSPHDCRRTYASLEFLNGTDLGTLKAQLGHRSLSQTEAYIKDIASPEERKSKIRGCGLLLQEPSKINVYAVCTKFPKIKEA